MEQLDEVKDEIKRIEFGPADEYTKAFIYEKGGRVENGYRKVATAIGATPASLKQFMDQKNRAGRDTITRLYQKYPDFDIIMAMTGEPADKPITKNVEEISETAEAIISKLTDEIVQWGSRYDKLEKAKDVWEARFLHLNDNFLKQINPDLSFQVSGSRVTAEASQVKERTLIGFGRGDYVNNPDAIIRQHPATEELLRETA